MKNVTTIDSTDGTAKRASHKSSAGVWFAVKHEIGGIRDRQDEARRIGDERAHEE